MRVINQERLMPDRLRIKTRKIPLAGNLTLGNKPYRIQALLKTVKSMQRARDWNGSHEHTLFPQMLRTENLME